jgi:hypothetical protein
MKAELVSQQLRIQKLQSVVADLLVALRSSALDLENAGLIYTAKQARKVADQAEKDADYGHTTPDSH